MIEREPPESPLRESESRREPAPLPKHGISQWVREPLLHFLILGVALFVAYSMTRGEDQPDDQQIVVSAGKIEHLAALFGRTWQRPPTANELKGLIEDYVREEIAYREGKEIGLDQNDTIIRRRIRQKLDFVAEDLVSQLEPTDEDLEAYLEKHEQDFRIDPRLSFRQVFFDPTKHGDDLMTSVSDLVAKLRNETSINAEEEGDRTLLDFRYEDLSRREVASLFGTPFAQDILELEPGSWHGPIESAYGVHAVIVDDLQAGRRPQLDEVRQAVRREWEHSSREQLTEEFYQGLLEKYEVVVEFPETDGEPK